MYAYINGILTEKDSSSIVIETGGIGYLLFCPLSTLAQLDRLQEKYKLYTYLNVKEDLMQLYGFYTKAERDMFMRLISVSGIGPKVACSVLSFMSAADLAVALITDDVRTLSKVPGIGKKTAQRLILELKEKVDTSEAFNAGDTLVNLKPFENSAQQEALHALIALGISQAEASRALANSEKEGATAEELIKSALRSMDAGR